MALNIANLRQIYHQNSGQILTAILIILVGIGGFAIGRQSVVMGNTPELRILSASVMETEQQGKYETNTLIPPLRAGGQVVASKSGTKYHLPWCSGAQRIKEENKVWFDSEADARKAGYEPASNCKGLE